MFEILGARVHIVDGNGFYSKGTNSSTNVGHAIDAMALLYLGWPKIQMLIIMSIDRQSFTTYCYFRCLTFARSSVGLVLTGLRRYTKPYKFTWVALTSSCLGAFPKSVFS